MTTSCSATGQEFLTQKRGKMGVGRYVLNSGIISSAIGALGVAKQTKKMPRDWRRFLVWATWGISFVLAVASVRKSDSDAAHIEHQKAVQQKQAEFAKATKRSRKHRR